MITTPVKHVAHESISLADEIIETGEAMILGATLPALTVV
jgi:hypothetical protein